MELFRVRDRACFRRAVGSLGIVGLLGGIPVACRDSPRPAVVADEETAGNLDRYVSWLGDIQLEENDTVINVLPRMNLDHAGGFLIADEAENQVRIYASDGRLLHHFGRKGSGPKEFVFLHGAMRLGSAEVLAVDYQGKGVVFDSTGATADHTFLAPIAPVQFVRLVNDTLLLLGGKVIPRRGQQTNARLHLWNLARDTIVRSFFTPPITGRAHTLAATTGGFIGADVRHDTVAAVFMLMDTIYFFQLDGRKLGQIPIPFQHFRPLSEDVSVPGPNSSEVEGHEWIGTFSMVSDIFWLRDGFLVQYQDRAGKVPHWRLLRMRRDGTRVFDVVGTPMLLAVDPRDETLYFAKPGSITANAWSRGRLRG